VERDGQVVTMPVREWRAIKAALEVSHGS
jgi:hypothetical protein